MKNNKVLWIAIIVLTIVLICVICFVVSSNNSNKNIANDLSNIDKSFAKGEKGTNGQKGNGRGRDMNGGGVDKSSDEELQSMIAEVKEKYKVFTFEDSVNGEKIEYNLFTPENYDETKEYPLIMFIPDSSLVNKSAESSLTQGYGGIIWATAEEQAKHPCFVLVPVYTQTLTTDNWTTGTQIETTVRLIEYLENTYSIDKNRVYTTGQSMGCMTSMYLNITYPDLFAASLFVGGQWDTEALRKIEDKKFFYIVAEGDQKASVGFADLKEAYEKDNVNFSVVTDVNAKANNDENSKTISNLLSKGNNINFVEFELGTVLPEGMSIGTQEHMYSFDYAYKIEAVRDWLFEQSK